MPTTLYGWPNNYYERDIMSKPIRRILVTNDDGIDAPGLKIAAKIAAALSDDVWIVAPAEEQSGASHSLSLSHPVHLIKRGAKRYAVRGTPTDCVMIATRHLLKDNLPTLILSGVNFGQNAAEDVSYSGTVAGAKEGTVFGIPSVALSQAIGFRDNKRTINFGVAEKHGPKVIKKLMSVKWPTGTLMNINFPDIATADKCDIVVTKQGKRDRSVLQLEEREDPRGMPYFWYTFDRKLQTPPIGTDIEALYAGNISVTALKMDHTDVAMQRKLGELF